MSLCVFSQFYAGIVSWTLHNAYLKRVLICGQCGFIGHIHRFFLSENTTTTTTWFQHARTHAYPIAVDLVECTNWQTIKSKHVCACVWPENRQEQQQQQQQQRHCKSESIFIFKIYISCICSVKVSIPARRIKTDARFNAQKLNGQNTM